MKKTIIALCLYLMFTVALFAGGALEVHSFTRNAYVSAVENTIGHTLDQSEKTIADTTWNWYDKKWESAWDQKKFDYAVESGVKNCTNKAILAAAKAGKFGEKLLKALIVSAGDAAEAFSDWVDRNSSRYDRTAPEENQQTGTSI